MSSRVAFNTKLSSIMESVARFALLEVHRVVDQDSAELLMEVARLMEANAALEDKVSRLESQLAALTGRDAPGYRSMAAQTAGAVESVGDRLNGREIASSLGSVCPLSSVIGSSERRESSPYSLDRIPKKMKSHMSAVMTYMNKVSVEGAVANTPVSHPKPDFQVPGDVIENQLNGERDVDLEAASSGEELKGAAETEDSRVIITVEEVDVSLLPEDSQDAVVNSVSKSPESFSSHVLPVEEEDDKPVLQEDARVNSVLGESSHNIAAFEEALKSIQSIVIPSNLDIQKRILRSVYSCHICNKTFSQKGALALHEKSHNSKYCKICLKLVPRGNKNKHKCSTEGPIKTPSQPSLRVCDMCGKHFPSPSALRMHQATHTGEKPHKCPVCTKGFTQKGNLKSHLRIHNGEKPFQCFICMASYAHMKNLKAHLSTHDN